MFSLPRDTVDVPVPAWSPARVWGRSYGSKINAWFAENRRRADLWPGNDRQRGYNSLKAILGELYNLDIHYFVEVNFDGFKKVVDSVGGVTINVQVPVVDDQFPGRPAVPNGCTSRAGSSTWTASRRSATRARATRRPTSTAGRASSASSCRCASRPTRRRCCPRLPELVDALKTAVGPTSRSTSSTSCSASRRRSTPRTSGPTSSRPPLYSARHVPDARGWSDPEHRPDQAGGEGRVHRRPRAMKPYAERLAGEGAGVWVLNGTDDPNRGTRLAGYLEYHGLDASAPRQKPEGSVPAKTVITVYNGAETDLSARSPISRRSSR